MAGDVLDVLLFEESEYVFANLGVDATALVHQILNFKLVEAQASAVIGRLSSPYWASLSSKSGRAMTKPGADAGHAVNL